MISGTASWWFNQAEAAAVRRIFGRYAELGAVRLLRQRLAAEGITGKSGSAFSRGALFYLLQNRLYLGEIVHKENIYAGEHAAIVDADLWQQVQAGLADHRHDRQPGLPAANPSLLAGLVFDSDGQPMTATHAKKGGRRYRYYISRDLVLAPRAANPEGLRIPAAALEGLVVDRLLHLLSDQNDLLAALQRVGALPADAPGQLHLLACGQRLVQRWASMTVSEQQACLHAMLRRVDVSRQIVSLHVVPAAMVLVLQDQPVTTDQDAAATCVISVPTELRRTGKEMALVVGADVKPVDAALVRLIAKARSLREALIADPTGGLSSVAAGQGVSVSYASRPDPPGLAGAGHRRGDRPRPATGRSDRDTADAGHQHPAEVAGSARLSRVRLTPQLRSLFRPS